MVTQRSVPAMFFEHMREQLNRSRTLKTHGRCLNPSRKAIPVNCEMNIYSGNYSVKLLCSMADCQTLAPHLLEWLASHPSCDVRIAVSENCGLSIEALEKLAKDESADVRYAMAENHNLPLAILEMLCEDENPYVVCRACKTKDRLLRSARTNSEGIKQFPHRAPSSDSASESA